jgi:hypothetical protein
MCLLACGNRKTAHTELDFGATCLLAGLGESAKKHVLIGG